ncbi:hypothetical protein IGI04_029638 [Brassica rapa subsp. trilocularis]|uniref:Reverse transcriptase zinc-binding domain-containing protein n=1 Tax=Brassica rapa subsp. trilocularis TaxID=1813537 RepID=A0ABQ7LNE4_BRACM|nr:hypothetical protein IGI04_029638 [Brassica rapa subsp. trilocularis]
MSEKNINTINNKYWHKTIWFKEHILPWINQPRVNADAHAIPVIKLYFQSAIYLLWKERNARVFTAVSSPSSVILASLNRMMRDRLLSYPASSSFSSSLLLFIFLWTKKAP